MAHWEMEGQAGEREGPFFPDGRRKPELLHQGALARAEEELSF